MSSWNSGPLPPDVNNGAWAVALAWSVRALAIIIVTLRLYTRKQAKNTAGLDDACILVAACLTIFGGINDCLRLHHGWGRHAVYLSDSDVVFVNKWMLIGELSNFCSTFFVRLSVCFFTLRLLPRTQKWACNFTYFAIALNFTSTLANLIVFPTRCNPIQAVWDNKIPGARCLSYHQLAIAFGILSACGVVVDFVVVVVPVFVIRNLQMNRRTKIGISVIMCLSICTALCSIGKMVSVIHVEDPVYDTVPVYLFSIFEEDCGIICASMPAMRQLYKHIKSKRTGHTRIPEPPANNPYSVGSGRSEVPRKSMDIELNEIHDLERDVR